MAAWQRYRKRPCQDSLSCEITLKQSNLERVFSYHQCPSGRGNAYLNVQAFLLAITMGPVQVLLGHGKPKPLSVPAGTGPWRSQRPQGSCSNAGTSSAGGKRPLPAVLSRRNQRKLACAVFSIILSHTLPAPSRSLEIRGSSTASGSPTPGSPPCPDQCFPSGRGLYVCRWVNTAHKRR